MCYCFKNLIQFFKESTKETKQHIFYHCSDSPYGLISFELLTKIRQSIEKTKDPKDKHYLRFLERYIYILDRMCKENSKKLLSSYFENLKRALYLEKNSNYSFLITLTIKSLKLGLKIINPFKPEKFKDIDNQICNLQNKITKFRSKNKDLRFINLYCKILIKLPRLTFIRRGLFLNTISITSL